MRKFEQQKPARNISHLHRRIHAEDRSACAARRGEKVEENAIETPAAAFEDDCISCFPEPKPISDTQRVHHLAVARASQAIAATSRTKTAKKITPVGIATLVPESQ
jgi:hypothetical protein